MVDNTRDVTTTGGGDLLMDTSNGTNRFYTNTFNGTSSASPVIVGVLACIQGVLKAAGKPLLTPASAVKLLRENGSPQQDGAPEGNGPTMIPKTQRIGNRPDLKRIIEVLKL